MGKYSEYMKGWRARNKERLKASNRAYYEQTKESQKARAIQWQKDNPERTWMTYKVVAANRRYPGKITVTDFELILARDGRKCCWCGKSDLGNDDLTLEHLEPINDVNHLTIACHACNAGRKHRGPPTAEEIEARKERARQHSRRYRERNREKVSEGRREQNRDYYQRNRERILEKGRRQRAERRATLPSCHTSSSSTDGPTGSS